jgi:hypothetical protein
MAPADQQAAQKVVLGCMKLLFDQSTHPYLLEGLKKAGPLPQKLATETVGVMKMFSSRVTNGQIPRQVLLPAASLLLLEIAKFAAKAGLAKPTGNEIKQAGNLLPPLLMKAFPPAGGQAPAAAPAAQPAPAAPAPAGLIGGA